MLQAVQSPLVAATTLDDVNGFPLAYEKAIHDRIMPKLRDRWNNAFG
jgi:hypothetical protein